MIEEAFARYMQVLGQTERALPEHVLRYQQTLLSNVVRHAHANVPFYRQRLAGLFDAAGALDLSHWASVPIVTKSDAIAHTASMRSPALDPAHGEINELWTSGSTTTPLPIASSQMNFMAANAAMTRMASWWGVDVSRPLARLRIHKADGPQYPDGRTGKGWSLAAPEADTFDLDLRTPVDQQIEWLLRRKAPYLVTAPSNATAIAYAVTPEQARALAISVIFTVGETVLPRTREIVAERLGARIAAIYSCEEIGTIATQCPVTDGYHVAMENALVEVLKDDGSAAGPGEVGQVVVTGFHNFAMPFIRYAIGDAAVAGGGPCACGRSLPVLEQVTGRTRSAFVFEDGTRVWPRAWDARAVCALVPNKEFQMVQIDHRRIELRYVPDDAGSPPDAAGLDSYVRQKIHPSAEITLVPQDTIVRGPGGKLELFVSMVSG